MVVFNKYFILARIRHNMLLFVRHKVQDSGFLCKLQLIFKWIGCE